MAEAYSFAVTMFWVFVSVACALGTFVLLLVLLGLVAWAFDKATGG
jgi:hypothetical protein